MAGFPVKAIRAANGMTLFGWLANDPKSKTQLKFPRGQSHCCFVVRRLDHGWCSEQDRLAAETEEIHVEGGFSL